MATSPAVFPIALRQALAETVETEEVRVARYLPCDVVNLVATGLGDVRDFAAEGPSAVEGGLLTEAASLEAEFPGEDTHLLYAEKIIHFVLLLRV